MLIRHHRNWNGFAWVTCCLLAVCVGTGCSTVLLGKGPEDEKIWTCDHAADEAMKRHDYETGLLLHERFLEKNPSNALALYHFGYANGRMGDHQKEVIYYEEAIALGLKEDRIFYNLGMAYGELNRIEDSIGAFKKALAMNPDISDNHFGLAMAYYQSGTSDKAAEEEFLKVIQMDPGNLDARLYLSMLYTDMGNLQKATEQLQEILAVDPTHSRAIEFLERIRKE
jgi:tetratricopeptide (TPR) repeat protein